MNARHPSRRDWLACAAATVAAGACGTAGRAATLTSIDIASAHYPGRDYALPLIVAQQLGFMAHEGIVLNSISGSDGGGTTVRSIAQANLPLAEAAVPAAVKAILAGEDLRIIAGGCQTAGTSAWIVKRDSPIRTIHDLVGKTVGYTEPGSAGEAELKLSLLAAKIDLASLTTKAAGGTAGNITLLQTGGIDAAFATEPTITQHKDDFRVVFYVRDYVPRFMQTVWIASTDVLKTKGPVLAAFLRARTRGVDWTVSHPIEAGNRYAQATNQDPHWTAITLAGERPASYYGRGEITADAMALVATSMRMGNLIPPGQKLDLAKIIDQSALPASMHTNMNVLV